MGKFDELKKEVYEANMQLPELGLVLFTFGNASAVDREQGVFAIKPSGVPYNILKPEDIVVLDFENNVIEGSMRPSSAKTLCTAGAELLKTNPKKYR